MEKDSDGNLHETTKTVFDHNVDIPLGEQKEFTIRMHQDYAFLGNWQDADIINGRTYGKKILEDGELKTENEVSIGDTVTYKVPVTIPEDVFEVPIIVTDTIDQALTLNEDSLEADQGVTGLQFKENTSEKKEGCKVYTVTIPGETVKANAGKTITLTYTAVLNDKAVIDGAGSPNTVRLNYNVDNAIHVNIQSEDHTVVTKTHQGGKDKPEPDPDKPEPDPDKPTPDPDKPMPNPDHPDKPSKVPQTGQLWWPVIALGCAGAALLAVGIFKKKGK